MHYYQFHIRDYRADTTHLSPIEHYIYRSLLDWHYLDEQAIPKDTALIQRKLGLGDSCLTSVEQVLNEFFTECDDGWTQERVLTEISEYRRKQQSASKAGRASAKARKQAASERTFSDRSTNHKPLTINHKPLTIESKARPQDRAVVAQYMSELLPGEYALVEEESEKFFDHFSSNGWKVGGKAPMKDWKASVRNWLKRKSSNENHQRTATYETKSERADRLAREHLANPDAI